MNQSGNIHVNGDGNAVGNNNHILIDKRIFNKITHQPPPSTPGGPDRDGGSNQDFSPIALAFLVLVGIAIAAWKFALYADEIYLAGILTSLLVAGAQLLALGVGLWRSIPSTWLVDRLAGMLAAAAVFIAFYWSRQAFPAELTQIAVGAAGWQSFICNLSELGQQVATFHMLSISLVAIPGLFLTVPNSISALSAIIFFTTRWNWAGRAAIAFGSRGLVVFGLVLATAAVAFQTSAAFDLWKNGVFTANQNPFAPTSKGVKLCLATVM